MKHTLKIAIVGPGIVGSTLGAALLKHTNHFAIKYGARHPDKHTDILKTQPGVEVLPVEEAVMWADAVILAISYAQDEENIKKTISTLGEDGIAGKVLLDATNPLDRTVSWRWKEGISAGEIIAASLPNTRVFKAFNTVGYEQMAAADGSRLGYQQPLTMLFAGGDGDGDGDKNKAAARQTAEKIISGVGFTPKYVGGIRYARNLEVIAELWVQLAIPKMGTAADWGREFHFQVIGGDEEKEK